MQQSYCAEQNKACVGWVEKYFKDCLCNINDELSFGFGLISLVCWGVAEIPQIITNFHTKSSHGVSLAFLLTWVAGDVFNLVGCLLEPATLPTQYYTALLYTISTIVLVLQSVYYDHLYTGSWRKCQQITANQATEEEKKTLKPKPVDPRVPIPSAAPRKEFYYMSARSLAGSGTPPFRTYMRGARSGPPAMAIDSDSTSEDEEVSEQSKKYVTRPRPIPNSVGRGAFVAASVNLPLQSNALGLAQVLYVGRKLLHEHRLMESNTVYGQCLGWMMAAIYMGGRLPQIWLNIKRGSVEGLNPLMFIFALVANATYVGSILVRTTEWEKIKANLPWLLDAMVCVALDLFIILQYIYYRYIRKRTTSSREDHGDYVEASKALVS